MGKQPAERPTVLWRDPVTGNRFAVGDIIPNTVVGIFHHAWKHPDHRSRRDQAMGLVHTAAERLNPDHSPLLMAAYVHPEKSATEGAIPDPADALVDKMLDLASTKIKGQDGTVTRTRLPP